MSSPASQRFAAIPELLTYLVGVIRKKASLCDLCFVSKSFNAVISPSLYSEMKIDDAVLAIILKDLKSFSKNPYLQYVRSLVCCVTSTSLYSRKSCHGDLVSSYNEVIIKLLPKIPELTTFSWSHQPLYTEILSSLYQRCPKLLSLSISYPHEIEEQLGIADSSDWDHGDGLWELRPLFTTQPVPLFANLQILKLHNVHGDLVSQRSHLTSILLASPNLIELSLSINSDAIFRLYHAGHSTDYLHFLEDLCNQYATLGGVALRIRSLCLGLSILPTQSIADTFAVFLPHSVEDLHNIPKLPATYIRKLTDLHALQDLSIHNGGRDGALDLYAVGDSGIAWDTFAASACPELKSISIYLLNEETSTWLASKLQHLTHLRIETSDDGIEPLFDLLRSKPGTALSNELDSRPSVLQFEDRIEPGDAEHVFPLFAGCRYLRGLKIVLQPSYISSRSSSDSGPSGYCFDAVKGLVNLEQLYISTGIQRINDDEEWRGSCYQFAHEIANKGEKLGYLKVGEMAWRVWREGGGVRMEVLDKYEEGTLQLFRS